MSVYTSFVNPQLFPSPCSMKASLLIIPSSFAPSRGLFSTPNSTSNLYPCLATSSSQIHGCPRETRCCTTISRGTDSMPDPEPTSDSKIKPKRRGRPKKVVDPQKGEKIYPTTIPRKPRRGRRSEAVAPEDFVRDSLEKTPAAIREQNSDILENKEKILKERVEDGIDNVGGGGDQNSDDDDDNPRKMVVDEDCPNWPLDADVGWGIRASEYFEKHPIKNVIGEDGVEIDWEGEIDNSWVEEINCLEWETFAFHPSPLIVLVFERYNRAADNWKLLKEMEKALQVYWNAKDRLPPRAVKIDINLERDLAYALQVRECPRILFLRGHKILYREKEFRSAEELVNMIAYFYYKAKKPSWIDDAALAH